MPVILPFRAFRSAHPAFYIPGEEAPQPLGDLSYIQDSEPALFIYRQRFHLPGDQTDFVRDGVMGLLNRAEANVFTHEEIIPERVIACQRSLNLAESDLGSLWLWCNDSQHLLAVALKVTAPPDIEVTDQFGCIHELWRMTDKSHIQAVQAALANRPLFLADGHHRLAAGLTLSTIQISNGALRSLASHRLLTNVEETHLSNAEGMSGDTEQIERYLGSCSLSYSRYVIVTRGPVFRGVELASGVKIENVVRAPHTRPCRGIANAIAAVESGTAQMAILVQPFSVSVIERNAGQGILLPPKSTDFFPKLAAGLVMHRS